MRVNLNRWELRNPSACDPVMENEAPSGGSIGHGCVTTLITHISDYSKVVVFCESWPAIFILIEIRREEVGLSCLGSWPIHPNLV